MFMSSKIKGENVDDDDEEEALLCISMKITFLPTDFLPFEMKNYSN